MVSRLRRNYEEDPQPRKLGHMYCFAYNDRNEPRVVVGPDFLFSIAQVVLANLVTVAVTLVPAIRTSNWIVLICGVVILTFENICFGLTVCVN